MTIQNMVFNRDGWQCRHCKDRNALHAHHVLKRSHQGTDTLDNLITLCAQCHRAHHDGKLEIEVMKVLNNNVQVMFHRVKDWRPV